MLRPPPIITMIFLIDRLYWFINLMLLVVLMAEQLL